MKKSSAIQIKIIKKLFVQDIGSYEVIHATHQFFQSKKILDVCSIRGKSTFLHFLGYEVDCMISQILKLLNLNKI